MVFSTIVFLCMFLPITIILYYVMPKALKNYFLLAASLFFYAWGEPKYLLVMLFSIFCNYLFGIWLFRLGSRQIPPGMDAGMAENAGTDGYGIDRRRKKAKLVVTLAVIVNIGILFVFKYMTFAMENLQKLIPSLPVWQIALPIGISFYTFQGLSYVIDVYRDGGKSVQKNPCKLALYISMFPQLIAGPIVRYKDIALQLDTRTHSAEKFADGVTRFVTGLAKKAILANMTGALADSIMQGDFSVMSASVAWLGAIAYTLQIYLDFSGYSDMAIGLGKMFGFTFLENFDHPYIATSVREFWRRWHMSLSGWFRDYLYIPLGGSRSGNVYLNLLLVFLATGIWHGAAWGFLLWGLWHGFFVLLERFLVNHGKQKVRSGIAAKVFGWLYTMLVVVIGWVLFSLVQPDQVLTYLGIMFGKNAGGFHAYGLRYYLSNQTIFYLIVSVLVCIPWKWKKPEGLVFDVLQKILILGLLVRSASQFLLQQTPSLPPLPDIR